MTSAAVRNISRCASAWKLVDRRALRALMCCNLRAVHATGTTCPRVSSIWHSPAHASAGGTFSLRQPNLAARSINPSGRRLLIGPD